MDTLSNTSLESADSHHVSQQALERDLDKEFEKEIELRERVALEKLSLRKAGELPADTDLAFDPEDPSDLALIAKLRQREIDEENQRNLKAFEECFKEQEPWQGTERKANISDLRKLVVGSEKEEKREVEVISVSETEDGVSKFDKPIEVPVAKPPHEPVASEAAKAERPATSDDEVSSAWEKAAELLTNPVVETAPANDVVAQGKPLSAEELAKAWQTASDLIETANVVESVDFTDAYQLDIEDLIDPEKAEERKMAARQAAELQERENEKQEESASSEPVLARAVSFLAGKKKVTEEKAAEEAEHVLQRAQAMLAGKNKTVEQT